MRFPPGSADGPCMISKLIPAALKPGISHEPPTKNAATPEVNNCFIVA